MTDAAGVLRQYPSPKRFPLAIGFPMTQDRKSLAAWLQAAPMMLVFAIFFVLPLVFVVIVSAWDYNEYEMLPAFSLRGPLDLHHRFEIADDVVAHRGLLGVGKADRGIVESRTRAASA